MPRNFVVVKERPPCDFCKSVHDWWRGEGEPPDVKEATYDGKTNIGPWANMCDAHFKEYGTGLGLGKGQALIVDDGKETGLRTENGEV